MKTKNKMQKEGKKRLTGLQGQKPCKNLGGKQQKILWWSLSQVGERGSLKLFEKVPFEKSKLSF